MPHALTVKIAKDVLDERLRAYYWANRLPITKEIFKLVERKDTPPSRRNAAIQAIRKSRQGRPVSQAIAEVVLGGKTAMYEPVFTRLLKRIVQEQHGRVALYFFDVKVNQIDTEDPPHYRIAAGYFLFPEVIGLPDSFDPKTVAPTIAVRTAAEIDQVVDGRLARLTRVPVLGEPVERAAEQGDAILLAGVTAVQAGKRWEPGSGRNIVAFTTADDWPANLTWADQLVGVVAKARKTITVEIDGVKTDLHIHVDRVYRAVLADPEALAKRHGYASLASWRERVFEIVSLIEKRGERDAVKRAVVGAALSSTPDIRFEPFPDYWVARHIDELRASGFAGSDGELADQVRRSFHETVVLREIGRRVGIEVEGDIDSVVDWALNNLTIERITTESNRALADHA